MLIWWTLTVDWCFSGAAAQVRDGLSTRPTNYNWTHCAQIGGKDT